VTEARAHALIHISAIVVTTIGVLGLAALGVRGVGLSLGALIPLAVAASASARVVMHYGDDAGSRKR
jgi:hypothetical protein